MNRSLRGIVLGALIGALTALPAWGQGVQSSILQGTAPATVEPARFLSGSVPQPPPQTIGWLEAVFDAQVTESGDVETIERLGGSDPLVTLLHDHLIGWRFTPARDDGDEVSARVLIAAIYRPATLLNQTEPGVAPPIEFDASSPLPRPLWMPSPGYPPQALGDGVVVVELQVTDRGQVAAASVVRSAGTAFDASALQTARRWQFSPASPSAPRPTFAYVIFGFRQPVVTRP
jgi:TonB family protein